MFGLFGDRTYTNLLAHRLRSLVFNQRNESCIERNECAMKLLERKVVGVGVHRSGWPSVMQSLQDVASNEGILLDDFCDASFKYRSISAPVLEPWVGVFHHPVCVNSPLPSDKRRELRFVARHRLWKASRSNLRGAIALCSEVADDLRDWLNVPTISLFHPTQANVTSWSVDAAMKVRRLLQVGYTLRNTRLIFQLAADGWGRVRLFGANRRDRHRDNALQRMAIRPVVEPEEVESLHRVDNSTYDRLMSESLLVTELFGAAANNLIVECMIRGTPIFVNRLPAVEEYLGVDYPLFYSDVNEISSRLDWARLADASCHLLDRATQIPSFRQFSQTIVEFTDSLEAT